MTEKKPNLDHESDPIKELLKAAMPRVAEDAAPSRDLWLEVLRKMDREPVRIPWFDWVLVGGLVVLAAVFPSAIPVFLYYL